MTKSQNDKARVTGLEIQADEMRRFRAELIFAFHNFLENHMNNADESVCLIFWHSRRTIAETGAETLNRNRINFFTQFFINSGPSRRFGGDPSVYKQFKTVEGLIRGFTNGSRQFRG
jgi:hypothetical protein